MKVMPKFLIFSAILAAAMGCGKNNESGKSNNGGSYCAAYGANGQCSAYVSNYNSQFPAVNGVNLNQVQQENPCVLSGGGYYGQAPMPRQVVQVQLRNAYTDVNGQPTIVPNGDMYVGVTSFGDVAAVIGNGTLNPIFVAYLCPRPASWQAIPPQTVLLRGQTSCAVKLIQDADVIFPDNTQANFRPLSPGGSSAKQKFSFCQM